MVKLSASSKISTGSAVAFPEALTAMVALAVALRASVAFPEALAASVALAVTSAVTLKALGLKRADGMVAFDF